MLEAEVRSAHATADLWADLAAARFEHARATGDLQLMFAAVAAADQALEIDAKNATAAFNRALALESIGLCNDAAAAYRRYLQVESDGGWAAETRDRLLAIRGPSDAEVWKSAIPSLADAAARGDTVSILRSVRAHPQSARTWAEVEFSAWWAEAILSNDEVAARRWLDLSRAIGAALERHNGDAMVRAVVNTIETTEDKTRIAAAHRAYREARFIYHTRDVDEALPLLRNAAQLLQHEKSPASLTAAYFLANAYADRHQWDEASSILQRLWREVPPHFVALRAQMYWLQATIAGTSAFFEGISSTRTALKEFERLGERENATRMRSMLSSLLAIAGDDGEAWRARDGMFRDAAKSGNVKLNALVLNHAARDEIENGQWETASALLRLQLAQASQDRRLAFDLRMSLSYADAKRTGKPADFTAAARAAEEIPDRSLREDAITALNFSRATSPGRDPSAATALLDVLIDQGRLDHGRLIAAHVERARALRESNRIREAESDLRTAIAAIERTGDDFEDHVLRDAYFGSSRDAYADLAELLMEQRRFGEAFTIADRGRARVLADSDRRGNPGDFDIADIQRALPAGTGIVHYSAMQSRLLIIAMDRRIWSASVVDVGRAEIASLSARIVNAIRGNNPNAVNSSAKALYSDFVEPVEQQISGWKNLIIVPDDETAGIPFTALRAGDGTRIIEKYAITFAPSAAAAVRTSRALDEIDSVVVVSDPAFDGTIFPDLQRLPAARRETSDIQEHFPHATRLGDVNATKLAVIASLASNDLSHVTTHAFADARDGSRSAIVLAPVDGDSGLLYARDIVDLPLRRAKLVVLAGCETGRMGGGTGSVRSIALAFIAAGADSVVAASWNVDDETTRTIMADFYSNLAGGATPSEAMRQAQLKVLHREPLAFAKWTPFQVIATNARESRLGVHRMK